MNVLKMSESESCVEQNEYEYVRSLLDTLQSTLHYSTDPE